MWHSKLENPDMHTTPEALLTTVTLTIGGVSGGTLGEARAQSEGLGDGVGPKRGTGAEPRYGV